MTNPEQLFWLKLRKHIPGFTQRIESSTGNGIPDIFGCWRSKPYWMELKVWIDGVGILLRKEQWAWGRNYIAHGGKSFVITQIPIDDVVLFMPMDEITVETYGTQGKYVLAQHLKNQRDIAVTHANIKVPLIKNLFP